MRFAYAKVLNDSNHSATAIAEWLFLSQKIEDKSEQRQKNQP
jgi:hypothetical protein